jgi:hypothetical protein
MTIIKSHSCKAGVSCLAVVSRIEYRKAMNLMLARLALAGFWTVHVFVLWYAAASHMTRRNDSIMQNHFVTKWESYFYSKHQKIKNKKN